MIFCSFGNHQLMSKRISIPWTKYYVSHLAFVCLECAYFFLEFWNACLMVNFDKMLIGKIMPKFLSGPSCTRLGGRWGGLKPRGAVTLYILCQCLRANITLHVTHHIHSDLCLFMDLIPSDKPWQTFKCHENETIFLEIKISIHDIQRPTIWGKPDFKYINLHSMLRQIFGPIKQSRHRVPILSLYLISPS